MMDQGNSSELISSAGSDAKSSSSGSPTRTSDRVANRLRQEILTGRLPVGSRLLPERKLAQVLKVSRVTVRSAIATLQSEQLVDVRRGSGITVLDYRSSSSIDLFTWLIASEGVPTSQQFKIFSQMLAVRRTLSLRTLFEAVEKAAPADLEALDTLIREQGENLSNPEAYLAQDMKIGQHIARIADNIAVELLHNSLRRCIMSRSELLTAFLGDLHVHYRNYHVLQEAFRQGPELTRDKDFQARTATMIDAFESEGLNRVQSYLDNLPSDVAPPPSTEPGVFVKTR